jgi:hypothetical protein
VYICVAVAAKMIDSSLALNQKRAFKFLWGLAFAAVQVLDWLLAQPTNCTCTSNISLQIVSNLCARAVSNYALVAA